MDKGGLYMQIRRVQISEIVPYENNPRRNDDAVEAVAESIRQCGYRARIIVDENMVVLAGHTRLKAMQRMGWTECEVQVEDDLNEEQKRKYRLLDNKMGELAGWDFDRLTQELDGLDFEGMDIDWRLPDVSPIDLADEGGDRDRPDDVQVMHCPKCGFVFEVRA